MAAAAGVSMAAGMAVLCCMSSGQGGLTLVGVQGSGRSDTGGCTEVRNV